MDYEKLHKDTINKLQQMVNSGKITVEIARGICADFVPESEDERIRKSLADYFAKFKPDDMWDDDFSFGDIVAWLEKQGEQILANSAKTCKDEQKSLVIPKFRKGDFIRYKTNPDDVERVDCVMDDYYILDIKGECTHVLFTCQDLWELVEQKPAWSEEDGAMFNFIALILRNHQSDEDFTTFETTFKDCIDWLKSLKERYTWKPSEEQMDMLKIAVSTSNSIVLDSLYNDLEKLKA